MRQGATDVRTLSRERDRLRVWSKNPRRSEGSRGVVRRHHLAPLAGGHDTRVELAATVQGAVSDDDLLLLPLPAYVSNAARNLSALHPSDAAPPAATRQRDDAHEHGSGSRARKREPRLADCAERDGRNHDFRKWPSGTADGSTKTETPLPPSPHSRRTSSSRCSSTSTCRDPKAW